MRNAEVVAFLCDLAGSGFYGDVTIRYRKGEPTSLVKNETFTDTVPVKNPDLVEMMETAGRKPAATAAS